MSNTTKTTSSEVATKASEVMTDEDTGDRSKSAAASALSQHGDDDKQTSPETASKASEVLRDGRTSEESKAAAASALSQAADDS